MCKRQILQSKATAGFTIVELLVVIGIIGVLISILLPAVQRGRQKANQVRCMAQMRDIGFQLRMYTNENRGWYFPVGPWQEARNEFLSLGSNVAPWHRWPMYVFRFSHPPIPDPPIPPPWTPEITKPWTPVWMQCPSDLETPTGNSYLLNKHLAKRQETVIRFGDRIPDNRSTVEVVLMGEKVTDRTDYYMELDEFDDVVEPYRHGVRLGSNYLYLDGHVSLEPPEAIRDTLDPWDLALPSTNPADPQP
jgi:prepilin-type processing-associated H-X9-DG protein/prepilin-type N-terminal cleavage/methylation domain-containing protein